MKEFFQLLVLALAGLLFLFLSSLPILIYFYFFGDKPESYTFWAINSTNIYNGSILIFYGIVWIIYKLFKKIFGK